MNFEDGCLQPKLEPVDEEVVSRQPAEYDPSSNGATDFSHTQPPPVNPAVTNAMLMAGASQAPGHYGNPSIMSRLLQEKSTFPMGFPMAANNCAAPPLWPRNFAGGEPLSATVQYRFEDNKMIPPMAMPAPVSDAIHNIPAVPTSDVWNRHFPTAPPDGFNNDASSSSEVFMFREVQRPRNRKPNYTDREKKLILRLISPHLALLDARSQERIATNLRPDTWKEVTRQYNEEVQQLPGDSVPRDMEELKNFWKNLRRSLKTKLHPDSPPVQPEYGADSIDPMNYLEQSADFKPQFVLPPNNMSGEVHAGMAGKQWTAPGLVFPKVEPDLEEPIETSPSLKTAEPSETESNDPQTETPAASVPAGGPYLLKRDTHCHTILDQLLRDDTYTDVTLTAEGKNIKAHRIVLSLASDYFRNVMSKESNARNVIVFTDLKFLELKNIINFIYTGEATVEASELEHFMTTAATLGISSLGDWSKKVSNVLKRAATSSPKAPTKRAKRASDAPKPPKKTSPPTPQNLFVGLTVKTEPASADYSSVSIASPIEAGPALASTDDYQDTKEEPHEFVPSPAPQIVLERGSCPYCPETTQKRFGTALLHHLLVSHAREPSYTCAKCSLVFTQQSSHEDHLKICSPTDGRSQAF